MTKPIRTDITLRAGGVDLAGTLDVPAGAVALVVFAHGSGSSRYSPRNQRVAELLRRRGFGTLLFDLLTEDEERMDAADASMRFDVDFLADRLVAATDWIHAYPAVADLPIAYFGASTGAAAALIGAARRPQLIAAVVSRGGRPDLARLDILGAVEAPVLLIVGAADRQVLELNQHAMRSLSSPARLEIVPFAGHLFAEPGALDEVARLAGDWLIAAVAVPRMMTAERSVLGRYADRYDAGRLLAKRLTHHAGTAAVVLALPRGGVVVAYEIARDLALPLDVCVVRKLGAPDRPELGIGAVAEGPRLSLDLELVEALDVSTAQLRAMARREAARVQRRVEQLRGGRPLPRLAGRTAILVDDGLATGGTMRAAIRAVRKRGAGRVVVAVPVGPPTVLAEMRRLADEVVCPMVPQDLQAVGVWYEDFDQVSDRLVLRILERARARETVRYTPEQLSV